MAVDYPEQTYAGYQSQTIFIIGMIIQRPFQSGTDIVVFRLPTACPKYLIFALQLDLSLSGKFAIVHEMKILNTGKLSSLIKFFARKFADRFKEMVSSLGPCQLCSNQ